MKKMDHYNFAKKFMTLAFFTIVLGNVNIEVARAQGICYVSGEGLMSCRPSIRPPYPTAPTTCNTLPHADMACLVLSWIVIIAGLHAGCTLGSLG